MDGSSFSRTFVGASTSADDDSPDDSELHTINDEESLPTDDKLWDVPAESHTTMDLYLPRMDGSSFPKHFRGS